jgi:DNA-binding transcriptional ArsR family regulator
VDRQLELAILHLLDRRAGGSTICPSEAARAIGGDTWRELMEPARAAGRRLHAAGLVEVLQRGRVVDPSTARGPIRLRRASRADESERRETPRRGRWRTVDANV